ncbi:hypothetical protein [Vibrio alfacsensis]|uniref:hypothetical protein n=1 Tax=Vibrio alfacsensis TaxID=1074311 RepID=UPI004068BF0D
MTTVILPRVEVSAHAIDRLSERCLHIWQESGKKNGIGLMSFFITKSREAYATLLKALAGSSICVSVCKISHEGVTYVFNNDHGVTRLVTAYLSEPNE